MYPFLHIHLDPWWFFSGLIGKIAVVFFSSLFDEDLLHSQLFTYPAQGNDGIEIKNEPETNTSPVRPWISE